MDANRPNTQSHLFLARQKQQHQQQPVAVLWLSFAKLSPPTVWTKAVNSFVWPPISLRSVFRFYYSEIHSAAQSLHLSGSLTGFVSVGLPTVYWLRCRRKLKSRVVPSIQSVASQFSLRSSLACLMSKISAVCCCSSWLTRHKP